MGDPDTDPGLLDEALYVRLSRAGVPSILIEAGGGLAPSLETVDRATAGVGTFCASSGRSMKKLPRAPSRT
jgi:hypothetical protein